MTDEYREATDEERGDLDPCYDLLVGPRGFECFLGEPEDRRWSRDAKPVVDKLNQLERELANMRKLLIALKPSGQETQS